MQLFDSHAHLTFDKFSTDLDDVLQRALDNGVTRILTIGTQPESSRDALYLAQQKPEQLRASVGIHPLYVDSVKESVQHAWKIIEALAQQDHCVGIGETGLDYYYAKDPEIQALQRQLFRLHLKLAITLNKPVIVHIRDAFEDAFQITSECGIPAGGVVHCFTGGIDECKRALELGYHISLSGVVTFKNAQNLKAAVPEIPLHRLLLETDAPFLAPTPYRGTRNEPSYVVETARAVAAILERPVEAIAQQAQENTCRLFNWPMHTV